MNQARLQFEKIKRSFDRIKAHGADDHAHDDLMHFFEDCWHLKDHIKFCLATSQQAQLEKDVESSTYLKIVADLANKSKHVVLNKKNRVDATITHKHIHAYDGKYSPPATAKYTVTLKDGATYDAHDIAREAMAEWQAILAKYNL
ncbi:MAG: hypothetical protein NT096_09590 [Proteobacteria bacterium]|nr:hypothetical protein [Pseudomonadota bacterium]